MNKTGWRQTDIREFLCEHNWSRSMEVHTIDLGNGFGTVTVGYKCEKCKLIVRSTGVDTGYGSVS